MMMMCCSPMHYSITSETVMETLRNTTGRGHRRGGGRRESIFPLSLNLTVKEYFPIWRKKVKSASTNCFHVKNVQHFFCILMLS